MRTFFLILATAFFLGLRHGIDWDHIAAITDIVGSIDKRRSFLNGTLYILGHASVIVLLGLLAVLVGVYLPSSIDKVMQPVVGFTLILLGAWLISAVIIHGRYYKMQSKWMVFLKLLSKAYNYIHKKLAHKHGLPHVHYPEKFSPITSFIVGMVHGVGAETPTQVVLFSVASGIKGGLIGTTLLFTFVAGLIISNSTITAMAIFGHFASEKNQWIHLGLGVIGGIFSIIVGIIFLLGKSGSLPALIGG